MSFFQKMTNPTATIKNAMMPKPRGGVIGPGTMKMPENAGDPQLRAGSGMMKASLSPRLKPLPSTPTQPTETDTSLLHSMSPASGLAGIKRKPSASPIGKHIF